MSGSDWFLVWSSAFAFGNVGPFAGDKNRVRLNQRPKIKGQRRKVKNQRPKAKSQRPHLQKLM